MGWYLKWLKACESGGEGRNLASVWGRRGLSKRTKQFYVAWAGRYAKFVGNEREIVKEQTATLFLGALVEDEGCSYATQKQAVDALAFFCKLVCGVQAPVFDVEPKRTTVRAAVVRSK